MIKECVILGEKIINIGEWEHDYRDIEITPAVINEETGETIYAAEYETIARNPMPEGAVTEERDFEYSNDRGWYEVGTEAAKLPAERIAELEQQNTLMQAALDELILGGGL